MPVTRPHPEAMFTDLVECLGLSGGPTCSQRRLPVQESACFVSSAMTARRMVRV